MKTFFKHLAFALLCISCTKNQTIFNAKNIVFDNFEKELSLRAKMFEFDSLVMAPLGIRHIDSFLLFKHHTGQYFFSIYNLHTNKFIGRFLQNGRGPNEFTNLAYWDEDILLNNERWLYMSDINLKKTIKFNLTNYLKTGGIHIETLNQHKDLQMKTHIINDSTFLAYMFTQNRNDVRVFYRKYFSTSDKQEEVNLTVKNINDFDEFNKLGGPEQIREDKKKMAKAMTFLNLIYIFDLEEPKNNLTLSPKGQRHVSLRELVQTGSRQNTMFYLDVRTTQEYIFALFLNQILEEWQRKPIDIEIHVFDWNGTPLYKLHIDEHLVNFCIDPVEKVMYAFDHEENIYQYDLSQIFQ